MANDPTTRFVSKANAKAIVQGLKAVYTNQDAIGRIKVGDGTFTAAEAVDQIELIEGSNVSITLSGDTITIAAVDTTYSEAVASVSGVGGTSGLFTGAEKEKLAGIAAGAEVNQNAFSNLTVGSNTVNAATKTDGLEFVAGTNVSIVVGNDGKLTFAATDTTYDNVTADSTGAAASGLMTSADKAKLDGIEAGADDNVIDSVKVNGTALTPDSNKAVNVTIATGAAGTGTLAVNGTDVTVHGLGTAAAATVETTGIASDTTTLATTAQVKSYVDGVASSAYKVSGTLTFAQLTALTPGASNHGNIYNVSDAFVTTSDFAEGAGKSYPAGTNVVIANVGTAAEPSYKFDAQAGTYDLSIYQEAADLGELTSAEITEILAEA